MDLSLRRKKAPKIAEFPARTDVFQIEDMDNIHLCHSCGHIPHTKKSKWWYPTITIATWSAHSEHRELARQKNSVDQGKVLFGLQSSTSSQLHFCQQNAVIAPHHHFDSVWRLLTSWSVCAVQVAPHFPDPLLLFRPSRWPRFNSLSSHALKLHAVCAQNRVFKGLSKCGCTNFKPVFDAPRGESPPCSD